MPLGGLGTRLPPINCSDNPSRESALYTEIVPMIMGSVLFGALLIGLANLAVDLLYTRLDPRVRLR